MNESTRFKLDPCDPVVVIGEYTLPVGPSPEDYLIVAIHASGKIFELTLEEFISVSPQIEEAVGAKVQPGLCNVTDLASRIIFPPSLEGHPLLNFERHPFSLYQILKLISRFGMQETSMKLTEEVECYVREFNVKRSRPS